jgi:sarcosine oxidase delta subunit
MQFEMCCPHCFRQSTAPFDAAGDEWLERMFDSAPVYALGDGETLEDMISTALAEHGPIHCPHCGREMHLSEESLGQLAMSMLVRM